jgi:four helix bundle protein
VANVGSHYRDLIAWQKAMDLVEGVYEASAGFPTDERFGLTSQVRRAVVSVASNIAEGQGRRSRGEFVHFLTIAHGSLREVETQILIAMRLSYLDTGTGESVLAVCGEVGRLISGLVRSLERPSSPPSPPH